MSANLAKSPSVRGAQAAETTKPFVWRPQKRFTHELKTRFLEEFVKSGLMYAAAESVGVTGKTVIEHAKEDEAFGAAYEEAKQLCTDTTLVKEARRRALEGTEKPLIGGKDKDRIVAYETVYDSRLHELLLKAERPDQYRENSKGSVNITGGVLTLTAQPMQSTDWERTVDRQGNIIEGSAVDTSIEHQKIDPSTGQVEAIDITPSAAEPAPAKPYRRKRIKHT